MIYGLRDGSHVNHFFILLRKIIPTLLHSNLFRLWINEFSTIISSSSSFVCLVDFGWVQKELLHAECGQSAG